MISTVRNLLLLVTVTGACGRPAEIPTLSIAHVAVLDVERGTLLADRTVLVYGSRIERVDSAPLITTAARWTIDGTGRFLIPGFWDNGLGTAEMCHIFISNRPGSVRPGTLGQVVPGFEVRVCDDAGRELPAGETGWLWVRGDSRAIGYWQQMEKTRWGFRGEWYVSGDLIRMDADGYVTYCGRGDDMLKVSGKWLAPQEVEGCLLQHPAVLEAAVVGVTDGSGLVKPLAFVVARERSDGLAEELRAFVRERLEPYKHPREVVFVDALPRTHLGKVDRGKLQRG